MSGIKDAKEMLAVAEHDFKALKGMTDSDTTHSFQPKNPSIDWK